MASSTRPPLRLSASIVVYNSAPELLRRTLESLYRAASVALQGSDDRLIIELVDNASEPAYAEQLRAIIERLPHQRQIALRLYPLARNRGFGAGHNAAMARIDSDFHLVLNPDAELDEGALLAGLRRFEANPDTVLVSPRVYSESGAQEFLCKRYPTVLVLLLRAFAPAWVQQAFARRLARYQMEDVCAAGEVVPVPLASGCCMLVRSAYLQQVGGFDERYFLYFEDFDLSLRLAAHGPLLFEPAMRIVHHGGYAARKGLAHLCYFVGSGLRFFNQHGWRWI